MMRRLPNDSLRLKTDSEQRHPLQLPAGTPRHDIQVCKYMEVRRNSSLCMLRRILNPYRQ